MAKVEKYEIGPNLHKLAQEEGWYYGEKGPGALRKYALDTALRYFGDGEDVEVLIDAAIVIENYLKGDLAAPNDLL